MSKQKNNSEEPQICEECGGTLKPKKMRLEEFEGGKLYVIEDAPVMECESCGEIWVPEPIINEFEEMMETAKKRGLPAGRQGKLRKIKTKKEGK